MQFYYVFSDMVTGYDIDASKNYRIALFADKEEAISVLKKAFYKHLEKTNLREKDKEKIINKFEKDVASGKLSYHFRDNRIAQEPQYFGKIHRRRVFGEKSSTEMYPIYRRKQASTMRRRWK